MKISGDLNQVKNSQKNDKVVGNHVKKSNTNKIKKISPGKETKISHNTSYLRQSFLKGSNPASSTEVDYRHSLDGGRQGIVAANLSAAPSAQGTPPTPDEIVQGLQDRNREFSKYAEQVPDARPYETRTNIPSITNDELTVSQDLQSDRVVPSVTFADDRKFLEDMSVELIKTDSSAVDRTFINPDTSNSLGSLQPEQKAAYVSDLFEAKARLTAYDNQYGDNVPGIEDVKSDLQGRIDRVVGDPDVLMATQQSFSRGAREFLSRPENSALHMRLQQAYLADIGGGKALDRELAAGKPLDEAFQSYSSEVSFLSSVLQPEFTQKFSGVASATLSSQLSKHYLDVDKPADLSIYSVDKDGNSETLSPVADAMSLKFMADNLGDSSVSQPAIKFNMARDITRNVDSVFGMMRNGLKFQDAFASFQKSLENRPSPLGLPNDVYKAGLTHAVQSVTQAGVLAARSIGMGPKPQPQDIAAVVANSVQVVGMISEGLAKNLGSAGKPFSMFGTVNGSWGDAASRFISPAKLELGGKVLGSLGGGAIGALSFFAANRALKAGEKAEAAFQIINGTAGLTGSFVGMGEVALQVLNTVPKGVGPTATQATRFSSLVSNTVKTGLAAVGRGAAIVGSVAGLVLGLIDMAKGVKKLATSEKALNNLLRPILGREVKFEFGPSL